ITPLNIVLSFIAIAQLLSCVGAIQINDTFLQCDKSTSSMVDLTKNCVLKKEASKKKFIDYAFTDNTNILGKIYQTHNFKLLSKRNDTVFGSGYECRVSELKTILKIDFWNTIF
ncbi:MAG: hypothetical protein ACK559_30505, partial [bacterium]